MRNDPFVHDLREAIVEFQRQSKPDGFPPWLVGFFGSFIRDYNEIEFMDVSSRNIYNGLPFEQRKKSFDMGFQAGIKLREAVEEIQKEYPKKETNEEPMN